MSEGDDKVVTRSASEGPKKGANKESGRPRSAGAGATDAGSIDKVRDILFGDQVRDLVGRLDRLEDRLVKESADLRNESAKRFETLEEYVKREFESVIDQLKKEASERADGVKEISETLKSQVKGLEKKIAQLDERSTAAQRDLRSQILDQSKSLRDEIQQKYKELSDTLEREAAALRTSKTDRSSLAVLLMDMAMRLDGDLAARLNLDSEDLGDA